MSQDEREEEEISEQEEDEGNEPDQQEREEDDDSEQEELFWEGVPIYGYYDRESEGEPHETIPEFLQSNYTFLAISGIFAALVTYLSNIQVVTPQQRIFGMTGAAIMFIVAFCTVIHNSFLEIAKAYKNNSLFHQISHSTIAFSLAIIAISVSFYFIPYPDAFLSALDTILGPLILIATIFIMRGRFESSIVDRISERVQLRFGRITRKIAQYSFYIAAISHSAYISVPNAWLAEVGVPTRPSYLPPESVALNILLIVTTVLPSSILIILFAAALHEIYQLMGRDRE
ncbi:hypothetical protein [Halopelagius fulvigenes]|uniref:Uncharacterized protein n=1 Tax=Halopelagius fulvigenes TaxID=1198324 RepID=A0ABD5U4A3_9EURY